MISGATLLSIGEVSSRSGVTPSAIRYYESLELVGSERTESGHRRFRRGTLRRIAFIVFAQRIGLTLEEIARELARLPRDAAPTEEDWAALSSAWVARVDARIAELELLRRGLSDCIGCGCLSLDRCRLVNPDDRAGRAGSGPRFWLGDRPEPSAGPE